MRIMVVDDNRVLGRTIGRALRGHDVVIEDDPDRALERLESGDWFDLIFCDVRMPKKTGPEVIEAIKSRFGADAPTLVLMSGVEKLAQIPGADGYLSKPFQSAEVQAVVALAEKKKSQRRKPVTQRLRAVTVTNPIGTHFKK